MGLDHRNRHSKQHIETFIRLFREIESQHRVTTSIHNIESHHRFIPLTHIIDSQHQCIPMIHDIDAQHRNTSLRHKIESKPLINNNDAIDP